ncbi:thiamine ABC transporter ATP-binding protein [Roseicitreum antarcticum]|uniref:Thiamine transport system ATP-binding protein n=1 Tax=Roseicitreum antarcticum TaxID=564137 RepID=A0A1H2QWA3_9RHOB|nr:ATP-binding cassette domain-containing protein [Roseicitreum antarcticum]SDW10924.1 thiamine transport system ATP-binding protein [Roseicitreum antarcticum]
MLRFDGVVIAQGSFQLTADFMAEPGARVAIMGPSGAGKSTLLNALAGFLPLSEGTISWQGVRLDGDTPAARPLSILFQDNNLFPHLNVDQNIALGLRPSLRLGAEDRRAVAEVLAAVGMEGMGARRPAQLSGGQQTRVALARVLLRARPLLLLDEPFAALGPALKAEMLALVARITEQTGAALLMVTHDPSDVQAIADQVIVVTDGAAHRPQPMTETLANPPEALRAYLGIK